MTIEEKRRELFECTTILPAGVVWNSDSSSYVGPNYWLAEYAWHALNRALDNTIIEVPKRCAYEALDEHRVFVQLTYELAEHNADPVELCRREDVIAAIEETGLGLKIK